MIKVVHNFSSFFGSIWLNRPLTIHNTVHWSVRHIQNFRCLLIYPIKWDNIGFFVACSLLKKANNLLTNFCHSWDVKLFTHFTKNAKYNNNLWEKGLSGSSKVHVAERKISQIRYLTYGWLFYKVHLLPPEKWQNRTKIQIFIWVQPQPKQ